MKRKEIVTGANGANQTGCPIEGSWKKRETPSLDHKRIIGNDQYCSIDGISFDVYMRHIWVYLYTMM